MPDDGGGLPQEIQEVVILEMWCMRTTTSLTVPSRLISSTPMVNE